METLKELLRKEIQAFRKDGEIFENDGISIAEFKAKSGGMGVYAQRGGKSFMLRLKIPSGVLEPKNLKLIYGYAEKYGLKEVHLTTRQAIQLHDLSFSDVCDIMEDCLDNDLYTRGGGGNFPRNVALSPLSGVEKGEAFDVTKYALAVNDYFLKRMNKYKLPRKIKVAFSNSESDLGNATIADLGFLAVKDGAEDCFKVFVAGGLGRMPKASIELPEKIKKEDIIYYVEAMIRLFVNEGNYEDKHHARIRFIAEKMGKEGFIECYKKYVDMTKEESILCDYSYEPNKIDIAGTGKIEETDYIIEQKQEGLYTVIIKPLGGQMKTEFLKKLIEYAEKKDYVEFRLSTSESIYVRNLTADDAKEIIGLSENYIQKTKFFQSIACVGAPPCQMGLEQSQKLLREIIEYFKENNSYGENMPLIHISGCGNSCARHQTAEIGFSGKKKRINDVLVDFFELFAGGSQSGNEVCLGKPYGDISAKDIPKFLYDISLELKKKGINFSSFYKSGEFEEFIKKMQIN